MEKLGVRTEETDEAKLASNKDVCPVCKSKIERHGKVLKCPKCGTKPFERRLPDAQNKE